MTVAVASGTGNATKLLERVKSGEKPYAFIEVMACPGGCVNGGGQPIVSAQTKMDVDVRVERAKALYGEDRAKPLRKSHENAEIKQIYADYLTKPGSHRAHELLHTTYDERDGLCRSGAIQFNTIGEVAYMHMRNDVSFIIAFELNLWEHQSKFNPNMPMRFFRYAAALYAKYIATSNYYEYSSSLQPVPRPKCVCFYNGTQEQPEKQVLKLSDAYEGEGDIEVKVTMLNINYGKNKS